MAPSTTLADRLNEALDAIGTPKRGRGVLLANLSKVSTPTVHGWLSGKHGAELVHLKRLAKALSVDESWLALGVGSRAKEGRLDPLIHAAGQLEDADLEILTKLALRLASDRHQRRK